MKNVKSFKVLLLAITILQFSTCLVAAKVTLEQLRENLLKTKKKVIRIEKEIEEKKKPSDKDKIEAKAKVKVSILEVENLLDEDNKLMGVFKAVQKSPEGIAMDPGKLAKVKAAAKKIGNAVDKLKGKIAPAV